MAQQPPPVPKKPRTPEDLREAHLSAKEAAAWGKILMILGGIGIPIGLIGWAASGQVAWIVVPLIAFGLGLAAFICGTVLQNTYKEF